MSTPVPVKITEEGLLLPRQVYQDLGEVEVLRRPDYILIESKVISNRGLRAQVTEILRKAELLVEPAWERPPTVPPEERAELARKFSIGRPLSEIIVEEREESW
jgi:hypothetical protein